MFNQDLANTFITFSVSHLIPVVIIFFILFLIVYFKESIRQFKYLKALVIMMASITILQEVSLNIYRIAMNEWSIATSLPLQLCGLGVLTSSYLIVSKNQKVFNNVFFIMMLGALLAIITPGIEDRLGFPHFRYFQFFISHGMIVINFALMLFVYDFQKDFTYKYVLNNLVVLLGLAAIMTVINLVVGGNYMYTLAKPGEGTAFDLFGEWPWYIINIFIIGIPIFFHLFYAPFFIRDLKRKKIQKLALDTQEIL